MTNIHCCVIDQPQHTKSWHCLRRHTGQPRDPMPRNRAEVQGCKTMAACKRRSCIQSVESSCSVQMAGTSQDRGTAKARWPCQPCIHPATSTSCVVALRSQKSQCYGAAATCPRTNRRMHPKTSSHDHRPVSPLPATPRNTVQQPTARGNALATTSALPSCAAAARDVVGG